MALRFLAGGGEMGELIRSMDWSATPLGDPRRWPSPLKTIIGVMLAANQPMFATWGPERIILYNDGYAGILGAKHPAALGQRFDEVWHEILDQVGPLRTAMKLGERSKRWRSRSSSERRARSAITWPVISWQAQKTPPTVPSSRRSGA